MRRYLFQKLLSLIPVLLGISLIAFVLGVISPGNPAEIILSQGGYTPSREQIEAMEEQLGLNDPYLVQYLHWLKGVLSGNLGTSYDSRLPVAEELLRRLPVTLKLAAAAMALACFSGVGLGCIAAAWYGKWPDHLVKSLVNLQLSFPAFWLALLMILLFAETLGWLPTSGNGGLRYMLMPATVLSSASGVTAARLMRSSLLAEFGKQYYTAAAARGISRWRLVICNALPNAIVPTVALLGNTLGGMLGGSVIIESIFALPGIGSYALDAISNRDYPALQGYVLLSGAIFVAVTLMVDIFSMMLDPKVRLEGSRK